MPFKTCSTEARFTRLWSFPPAWKPKPRITIEERAQKARNNRVISLEQAQTHSHLERFELGDARFQIFRLDGSDRAELTALMISCLGSAFSNHTIGFYFTADGCQNSYVTVKVAPYEIELSSNLYGPATVGHELLNLNFQVYSNYIHLSRLGTHPQGAGRGGLALTALYNIASGLNIRSINFGVHDHNKAAMRFYFHMDFGHPTNDRCTEWQVEVHN
ncbi:MAG: hypothetical protein KKB81_03335 [Candidatus Margulisbacteria bacterium]|nr:hypothetical protein [Candidatus Margulisiibacteriota bacterium]MBU1022279.1 hypothetical protein [Candidatus Margulisiibacteriota bacterium]MBU1729282.1 hypothetical protein [Candidatus Margulisiibacteriota bacterium]MBU1955555.1 hypothetical protein [Candidatus Margulisiibacteriota bacterium]